jgi:hypothetical protein
MRQAVPVALIKSYAWLAYRKAIFFPVVTVELRQASSVFHRMAR